MLKLSSNPREMMIQGMWQLILKRMTLSSVEVGLSPEFGISKSLMIIKLTLYCCMFLKWQPES